MILSLKQLCFWFQETVLKSYKHGNLTNCHHCIAFREVGQQDI